MHIMHDKPCEICVTQIFFTSSHEYKTYCSVVTCIKLMHTQCIRKLTKTKSDKTICKLKI